MQHIKPTHSQFGMALVEILVAVGLIAVIGSALSNLLVSGLESQKTVENRYEALNVLSDVRALLGNATACTLSFRNLNFPNDVTLYDETHISGLRAADNQYRYTLGEKIGSHFKLVGVALGQFTPLNGAGTDDNRYMGSLRLTLRLATIKGAGPKELYRSMNVQALLKGHSSYETEFGSPASNGEIHQIYSCAATELNERVPASVAIDPIWQRMVATPEHIYYDAGRVGVGQVNPLYPLDVVGAIRIDRPDLGGTGVLIESDAPGEFNGKKAIFTVREGNGAADDEIWIGPNKTGYAGHVQLVAPDIRFVNSAARTVSVSNGEVNAYAYYHISDQKLKSNLQKIRQPETLINRINGYTFNWRPTGQPDMGVVAQEVEVNYPELVQVDSATQLKTVKYQSFIALLIESVKDLFLKYHEIKNENKELKVRLEELNTELKRLREQIENRATH